MPKKLNYESEHNLKNKMKILLFFTIVYFIFLYIFSFGVISETSSTGKLSGKDMGKITEGSGCYPDVQIYSVLTGGIIPGG